VYNNELRESRAWMDWFNGINNLCITLNVFLTFFTVKVMVMVMVRRCGAYNALKFTKWWGGIGVHFVFFNKLINKDVRKN